MAESEKGGAVRRITAWVREWLPRPRHWWKSQDRTSRQILLVLFGVAVVFSVPAAALSGDWSGLFLNLGTELAGAVVTFILLNEILGGSRQKAALIREMGSIDNGIALRAVEELRAHGWLTDGSLTGGQLSWANLQGAKLEAANLQGVNLMAANLQEVNLWKANLQGAILWGANLQGVGLGEAYLKGVCLARANLQGAFLGGANLQGANLWLANLQGAYLMAANLQGALLWEANLERALIDNVAFDETTILPDGTRWTPDTDMARFTDPNHPEFWRSDDPRSPAYRGEGE